MQLAKVAKLKADEIIAADSSDEGKFAAPTTSA